MGSVWAPPWWPRIICNSINCLSNMFFLTSARPGIHELHIDMCMQITQIHKINTSKDTRGKITNEPKMKIYNFPKNTYYGIDYLMKISGIFMHINNWLSTLFFHFKMNSWCIYKSVCKWHRFFYKIVSIYLFCNL